MARRKPVEPCPDGCVLEGCGDAKHGDRYCTLESAARLRVRPDDGSRAETPTRISVPAVPSSDRAGVAEQGRPLLALDYAEEVTGRQDDGYLCQVCDQADANWTKSPIETDARNGRWIECIVDSGAVHSVAKRGTFPGQIRPSKMSKEGKGYRCASKTRIANEGEVGVKFLTEEGHKCGIKIQVADVERPLISTADLTKAGNAVVLLEGGGHVEHVASKKRIRLERRANVYLLRMWIPNSGVFARRGK